MKPVNNVTETAMTKKQAKKAKKLLNELQKEMADSVFETIKSAGKALDLSEIIAAYPDNARRRSCKDDKQLKLYISMGIGTLIEQGRVIELPQSADGKFPLDIA
jgi:hypothetical protein